MISFQLNQKIEAHFKMIGLDKSICKGLKYEMMLKLSACTKFTTTTTTTVKTTTRKSALKKSEPTSGCDRILLSFVLLVFAGIAVS